jgi:hypothetical protein
MMFIGIPDQEMGIDSLAVRKANWRRHRLEFSMSATDKAKNKAQAAKGGVKEAVGKAAGNPKLEAEGKSAIPMTSLPPF